MAFQCTEGFDSIHDDPCHSSAADAALTSPKGSAMGSRLPTQQEIQHMDELDLSVNLGALLGHEDSWVVDEPEQATTMEACKTIASKPFQELFP